MKKTLSFLGIMAFVTLPAFGDCYNDECAGSDIKSRRACYVCCASDCADEDADCQNGCDEKWTRSAADFFPAQLLEEVIAAKDDGEAQMGLLTDDLLWEWFVSDKEVNIRVIELLDFLWQNAADESVERMVLVTVAALRMEAKFGHEAKELSDTIMLEAMESDNWRVRRSALIGLQEAQSFRTNPRILIDMIRVTAQDPDQKVRDMGLKLLTN